MFFIRLCELSLALVYKFFSNLKSQSSIVRVFVRTLKYLQKDKQ